MSSRHVIVDWVAFGLAIKAARAERGLTQQQMADEIGLTRAYFSLIEVGKAFELSYSLVARICLVMQIKMPRVSLARTHEE